MGQTVNGILAYYTCFDIKVDAIATNGFNYCIMPYHVPITTGWTVAYVTVTFRGLPDDYIYAMPGFERMNSNPIPRLNQLCHGKSDIHFSCAIYP